MGTSLLEKARRPHQPPSASSVPTRGLTSGAEGIMFWTAAPDGFAGLLDQKREDGKTDYSTIAFQI
jgi:hypothetical protein